MRIEMRQGVVSHQTGGFLQLNGDGDINILAGNETALVAVAHHDTNYLHSEDITVTGAWIGPFTSPKYWLYWDFDLTTFNRTFNHTTLEPITQAIEPGTGGTAIVSVVPGTNNVGRFVVSGQYILPTLRTCTVSSSSSNDGLYTVFSSSYDDALNQTTIFVSEDIIDDTIDGQVTFEFDVDGVSLLTTGRMWYDTNHNTHYELTSDGEWIEVLRVFAAQLTSGSTFSSHSTLGSQTFTGTQIGDTSSVLIGRVMFTENSNAMRRDRRAFLTTEDQLFTNQSRVDALRLESRVARAKSTEPTIDSFTVVAWVDDGEIVTAQYDHPATTVVGILTEDLSVGEVGAVIIQGFVTNPSWSWTQAPDAVAVGSPLWIENGVLTPTNPHTENVQDYSKQRVPVARVLGANTIIFEQGLGGEGDVGPTGSVELLPAATNINIGAVTLISPSSDPQQSLVISDTDPRLTDTRTPSPHVHPAVEVNFTPDGGLISNNAQLALTELGTTKFNISGGTLSGPLILASDPTANLHAVTKNYVDGLVSGLVWLSPILLLNLISDNVTTPPTVPEISDAYIVPQGSIGDWAGITTGNIVQWDGTNWLDLGNVLSFGSDAARFGIAMQTITSASGSFAGLDNQIVIYDNAGNIDTFEIPTTNNAVFVNHTSSLHAFNQFAFDGTGWILFGGAAPVSADDTTTVLDTVLLGVKQFDDGGINDVSHWQGLVPTDLASIYSILTHSHNAIDLTNTPYTSSLNWGTLQDPTEAHITSITIQSALNELVDKKAGKQQAYTALADTPDASAVSGMTVYVQDDSVLYYATGGSWVQLATSGDDLSIPYDITFSIIGVLQQDIIVGTYVSGRIVDLAPSLPNSLAHTTLPAVDGSYVFRILHVPLSTGIAVEIGTITFAVGESFGVFDFPDAVEIGALDVLHIATDDTNPPDSGLLNVGVTIIGCSIATPCEPYVVPQLSLTHTLDNPNPFGSSSFDTFGFSVSIDGNNAIVGAYQEDDADGTNSGKAYIMDVTTGALIHTLDNPNPFGTSAFDRFGYSVSISGNNAIVGAYAEDDAGGNDSGKAYIFNVTTGALIHTIDNPTTFGTSNGDRFGYSVSINGNNAIVGAYQEDDASGSSSGKAYIFDVTTGSLTQTLDNPTTFGTSNGDNFGFSVSIDGNNAIVGAYQEDDAGGTSSGKAYIMNITTGALIHTLDNPTAFGTSAGDRFGYSVAISGNNAIVGAYLEDDAGGSSSGKAYIFDVTTGGILHTLDNPTAFDTSAFDNFGFSVSIDGNNAIVGAHAEDDAGGGSSGKAYIFDVTTGGILQTLDNPTAFGTSEFDNFGYSVSISGNNTIVGAYQEDDTVGTDSGKAYTFNVTTGAPIQTLDNPTAFSTSAYDYFGYSVSVSGDNAIVGAYAEGDVDGIISGKAYIFDVATGSLTQTLDNPNPFGTSDDDNFGYSVSIDGNNAIVGAYLEDDVDGFSPGKAYIFNVTTGALLHTLDDPNAFGTSSSDRFGYSVSISGNNAIVGAYWEDDAGGTDSGKAYIFDATTGSLTHTLDNPNAFDTSAFDRFGFSVSISGNNAIVGAYREDDAGGTTSGKAYLFDVTTGSLTQTLDNPNAFGTSASDNFGFSVSISGNNAIVGAYLEDDAGGTGSGKAYIFDVTTGSLTQTLDNPSTFGTSASDLFGYSVAISGNRAIIGAYGEDDAGGSSSGKAYIFDVATGSLTQTLDNPTAFGTSNNDLFGFSVSISGNSAIIGAYQEDDIEGEDSGKAYIFGIV